MFEFPTAPLVGDEYTTGGIVYAWSGTSWDIKGGGDPQDYVLKAGDEMTGTLTFDARPPTENAIEIGNDTGAKTMRLSGSSSTHTGIIELFAPDGTTRRGYIGYGDANWLNIVAEGAWKWNFNKTVTITSAADATGYFIGDAWHGMYFTGGNTLRFTEYHDRFEWRRQNSGAAGAGGDLRMSLYGGVLTLHSAGHFTHTVDGYGIKFHSNAHIYKKVGAGPVLREANNSFPWWGLEEQDGTYKGELAFSTTRENVSVEVMIERRLAPLLASIAELRAEIATLKGA